MSKPLVTSAQPKVVKGKWKSIMLTVSWIIKPLHCTRGCLERMLSNAITAWHVALPQWLAGQFKLLDRIAVLSGQTELHALCRLTAAGHFHQLAC